jgi:CRISPR-associated endonuclease/helicase Cas3
MTELLARSPKPEKGIPEQTYREHVAEVMRLAEKFADRVAAYTPYNALFRESVGYAAVYHDLGKLDAGNQKVLKSGKGHLPLPHWDAGAAYLMSHSTVLANMIAALFVYAHHIGLPALKEEQLKKSGPFRVPEVKALIDANLQQYLGMHVEEMRHVVCSQLKWDGKAANPLFMRMALSCLVDADHTDSAKHCGNSVPEGEVALEPARRLAALDNYVANIPPEKGKEERNALRRQVYDACRFAQPAENGLIACDSPVGTGKTTAIMAHLLNVATQKGLRRVLVVLPFTNIIDQSVDVYRSALVLEEEAQEKERVVAAHHHKAEFEEEANRAFSFLWNAPVTVTTAVQFFETLASNHPATLRKLHQLAGSAIFIDEAHAALPAHLWPQAWKWLQGLVRDWGCYIVMASGSLTKFWELPEFSEKQEPLPELVSPEVGDLSRKAEKQRICYELKDEAMSLDELCDWIQTLPSPRLVILNTVQSAAVVAREFSRRHGRDRVEHLSTALAAIHRKGTINRLRKRLKDKNDHDWTLVATSCVEAGVDFSFRSAARELCSLVSALQTAGRANRSGEFGTSELWGFRIKPGELLKEHPLFRVTAQVLSDMYRENMIAPEFCKEAMRREIRNRNQGMCADDPIAKEEKKSNFPGVNELFCVIPSNTMTVIVDEDLCRRIENHDRIDFREIQQKSVAIYTAKAIGYAVAPLRGHEGLHAWTLAYDDFLGYMAGVLIVADFADNCCI